MLSRFRMAKGARTTAVAVSAAMVGALVPVIAAGPAGASAADLRITEVWPGGSSNGTYAADWFEVTNTGSSAVDITGWKVDDSSNLLASALSLNGITSIAAGESVIFLESATPATAVPAFTSAWFGGSVPSGLQVGTYSGSGIGLSSSGDAVNLFDAAGAAVTGVTFGAAGVGATFDNATGATGAIATLSTSGTNGAFVAANGLETGSPGRLAAPTPPPPAGPSAIDLTTYVRVGRHPLPEPTTVTPPDGTSLLAQEVSGVTYDPDTDSLFVVGDGSTAVVQVSKTGELIDSMTLAPGASPQGTEFYDTEGITYVGNGQFALVEERDRQVVLFTYAAGTTLSRAQTKTVDLGTFVDNIGIEGMSWDPLTDGLVAVKEISPEGIFQTGVDWDAGTATNGSASTANSTNLFDPALAGLADLADVFALSNIPSLAGTTEGGNLLLLSQEDGRIVEIDRSGAVAGSLQIVTDPGNPLSVPNQQHEGLTVDHDGNLYVVNENGGGDINHPELWVYAPATTPNQAPTGVAFTGSISPVLENTSTATRLKVADVVVADDGQGTNQLSVTGPDAGSFVVDSNGLYVKAGTVLDFETKSSYAVSVQVDDTSVGATPDATSAPFVLTLTDVPGEVGSPSDLVVSEVSPWSSGAAYAGAADWFELTNSGTTPVDLTGWKVDDNSNLFSSGVALQGVSILGAGQSVVFVEGDATNAAAFTQAWFGSTPPSGLAIGTYSGGGVGLSTGGDAVNVFDGQGTRVTGVAFGVAVTGQTFDNTAGLGSTTLPLPTVTAVSSVGVNGAFTAANGNGVGSPGKRFAPVAVTEVSPWSSGSSPFAADWFELTNVGTATLDLTGWKMDDNSNSPNGAVALAGVASLAPGASAVFVEGGATQAAGLTASWFGATPSPGFQVGSYSGGGVGLSTGGDAVNVFDALGRRVTGVDFGVSTTGRTFDNAAAAVGTVSALSAVGVNGAITAADTHGVGSPGRTTNAAPTLALTSPLTSLAEGTSTASRLRVAGVAVTDDYPDTVGLSLTGPDAGAFEVDATGLYLRAGTALNFEAKTAYAVTVVADDATLGAGPEDTEAFSLVVSDVNEAPVATADSGPTTKQATAIRIPVATLLGNDTDPDAGAHLSIVPNGFSNVVGGTVALDGSDVVFVPNYSFTGTASFAYTVTDGALTSSAKVTVQVKPAPVTALVRLLLDTIRRLIERLGIR